MRNAKKAKPVKSHLVKLSCASIAALDLLAASPQAVALTDAYFVMGEDIDLMMETDKTYTVEEIEYELRKIPFFRELEDFLFKLQDKYTHEDQHHNFIRIPALGVSRSNRSGQINVLGADIIPVQQAQRPAMAGCLDINELLAIALQKARFAFLARNNHLEVIARAQMTTDFEQHDVIQLIVFIVAVRP